MLRAAAQAEVGHFRQPEQQLVQAAEVRQQRGGGLGADAGNARDVVNGVAGEPQVVGNLVCVHAIAGLHAIGAPALVAGVVPLFVVGVQQLRQVLVGRDDQAGVAGATHLAQGGADQVIGLVAAIRQHGQAQGAADPLAVAELALELFGSGVAVGLVGRVEVVAEVGVQGLIEGDGDALRPLPLEQLQHETGEAVHGVDRPAFAVLEFRGHRVPGPEHIQAGIHQVDGTGHGVQSDRRSRGSGRWRSGASLLAVPMWMKPRTDSSSPTPSLARTTGS